MRRTASRRLGKLPAGAGSVGRTPPAHDPGAGLALEMFCYHARKAIGSLAAALGGVDNLVFTAGIGEKSPRVRELIGRSLGFLGIEIDPGLNEEGTPTISVPGSRCGVHVIHTDEEQVIAGHTLRLVSHAREPQ